MSTARAHDIVLFGATGFTGELTARYLARNAPEGCRWALAGRNPDKLEQLRQRLAELDPRCAELPLITADVSDESSVRELAGATRTVISTVGPYVRYGEPLVAACAEAGTDYVDLTGEPEFVDRMYVKYHRRAAESGARLVHACGFDSVPHDLGVHFTVGQLPASVPLQIKGMVRAGAQASGGTLHSLVTAMERFREMSEAAQERRELEPTISRRVSSRAGSLRHDRKAGAWLLPFPSLDPRVIATSARALAHYGPDFTYRHHIAAKYPTTVLGIGAGLGVLAVAARIKPARDRVLALLSPGEGPSPQQRAKSWFRVRFVGEGGGRRVITEVSGGDPGYDETAKMLAESALCLTFDDNPPSKGQVSPAAAMGEALTRRLVAAGIRFRVIAREGKTGSQQGVLPRQ
jgi:short subunit dehydrogenase-like uncharacterized protein